MNNMKKESGFKLKSGNDIGSSVTKLMKQAPLREDMKFSKKIARVKNVGRKIADGNYLFPEFAKHKLESKIKDFFGYVVQPGVTQAQHKNRMSSYKREDQTARIGNKITKAKNKFESKIKKAGKNIKSKLEKFRKNK
tara:strand:+ start:976 stop:1386 length:411 start_codon:yes stop_codon:yes gene_type:complete